jgi:multidrug resistance protein
MLSVSKIVFFTILLDVVWLGLIIPIQPFLGQRFGATETVVTLLGSTYAACQFLFAPIWGSLSDRIGRRPVLLASISATVAGHLAFAFAGSLLTLFLARALAGLGAANIATAQAVISDTAPPKSRSKSMALIGAAFGVGFVLGPAIGGLLSQWDYRAPPLLAALLGLVNLALVWRNLAETRTLAANQAPSIHGLAALFSIPPQIRPLALTTFLTMTAFATMEQSISLYIQAKWVGDSSGARMEASSGLTSQYLVMVGVSAVFVQGFLVRKILPIFGDYRVALAGLIGLIVALLAIPLVGSFGIFSVFGLTASLLALGSGLFNPAMSGLVSQRASDEDQGHSLAVNQSAAAFGRVTGPLFAGWLFAHSAPYPFIVGAILVIGAVLVFLSQRRTLLTDGSSLFARE